MKRASWIETSTKSINLSKMRKTKLKVSMTMKKDRYQGILIKSTSSFKKRRTK